MSLGGQRFVSVCTTSFLCVVLSWLRTCGSSLSLCTTMEGFSWTLFMGTCSAPLACKWNRNGCFYTVYCTHFCLPVTLNSICSAAWFHFFIFFKARCWVGSWTLTVTQSSLSLSLSSFFTFTEQRASSISEQSHEKRYLCFPLYSFESCLDFAVFQMPFHEMTRPSSLALH